MRSRYWLGLCVGHAVASMLVWWMGDGLGAWMTWRADDWLQRPWTLWTSAWVHRNTPHLISNQLAVGALAAMAWVLRPDGRASLAWVLAWPLIPLCQVGWPLVGHYVGLSGLVHAAVAAVAVQLLLGVERGPQVRRWGWVLALGLGVKLGLEQAWTRPVVWSDGLGISVVQSAHLVGAVAGVLLTWGAMRVLTRGAGAPIKIE
ncbi:MAG TPA: rhomboid family intramembrane serine protease [Burkholderiaceae bacterium]|nr:rhomboid family intramembrane serine protease [Burkholderiaceae bacterium]